MSTKHRGFGSMDKDKVKAIATKGGRMAHQRGTAHEWTVGEATEAGRKGGLATAARRRAKLDIAKQGDADYADHTTVTPA